MANLSFEGGSYRVHEDVAVGGYPILDGQPTWFDAIVYAAKEGQPPARKREGRLLLTRDDKTELLVPYWGGMRQDLVVVTREECRAWQAVAAQCVERLKAGQSLAVCCSDGRERAAAVAALILRELEGCSPEESVAKVREACPEALRHPVTLAVALG